MAVCKGSTEVCVRQGGGCGFVEARLVKGQVRQQGHRARRVQQALRKQPEQDRQACLLGLPLGIQGDVLQALLISEQCQCI